jgi:hypothetical protein
MAEKDAEGLEGSNLVDSGLEENIAHWAEVLDRWIKSIDTRLGRAPGMDGDAQAPPSELEGDLRVE